MGFRLYKRVKIAPGIKLNFSRSGPSLTFGPKGAHYTVGPRGTRTTVGIPGTGMYYTTTSGKRRTRRAPAGLAMARQPGKPWSPTKKIVWGLLLFGLLPVGELMMAVGIYQMSQPRV